MEIESWAMLAAWICLLIMLAGIIIDAVKGRRK